MKLLVSHAGERTVGVLTKIDLMDKGTNALDVSFAFFFLVCFWDVLLCDVNILCDKGLSLSISTSVCA